MKTGETECTLMNTAAECVEATRNTIKMLGGDLVERDGRFYLVGPPFIAWAAERQGYVRSIVR